MVTNKDNFCVIMGGGIGSRFWPFSRKTLPKQFLDFFGTGRSLLQQTFDRFKQVIPMENILIVTNDLYADLVKEQLPELKPEQILLEPTRRNTAPCIAWASYHIRALNPNANIVVAPSDHLILKEGLHPVAWRRHRAHRREYRHTRVRVPYPGTLRWRR